jgi:FixJ family two-component response regulator
MKPTVYIVEDDAAVRNSLRQLIESRGLNAKAYASAEEFLHLCSPEWSGCLLLDVALPGMQGPELQLEIAKRDIKLPVIFLTAYGDIPTTVRAVRAGAFDFLEKPFEPKELIARLHAALESSGAKRTEPRAGPHPETLLKLLTDRERQVVAFAAKGRTNKEIARHLGISHRTVEIHRARAMHKMGARTPVELVALAVAIGLAPLPSLSPSEPTKGKPRPA